MSAVQHLTVFSQVTPNDPLSIGLVIAAVAIVAVALLVANHHTRDRF